MTALRTNEANFRRLPATGRGAAKPPLRASRRNALRRHYEHGCATPNKANLASGDAHPTATTAPNEANWREEAARRSNWSSPLFRLLSFLSAITSSVAAGLRPVESLPAESLGVERRGSAARIRAKGSQSPADEMPHLPTLPLFRVFSPMPSVQTKPIRSSPAGTREPMVRNKPNSRRTKYPIFPPFHHSNVPIVCLSCETKPIPPRAIRRTSTWWKKSYDALDTQKASAKQSQFPHGWPWAKARLVVQSDTAGPERAKQSQSAAREPRAKISHYSSILWLQDSGLGRIVRNKANFRGQAGASALEARARCPRHDHRQEQTPHSAGSGQAWRCHPSRPFLGSPFDLAQSLP